MTAPTPIMIEAEVDEPERPALVAGAQQLAEALKVATGADWTIQLRFWAPEGGIAASGPGGLVILSLLPEVGRDEPFAQTETRWRERATRLAASGATVMICTVFRSVPDRHAASGQKILERIRRLNRMAVELSHDLGVTVVDIDRAFAHIGARILATDYQLTGRLAAEVAGHAIALCLLTLGLDDTIPPEVQERARAHHGPLREIDAVVRRRLAAA